MTNMNEVDKPSSSTDTSSESVSSINPVNPGSLVNPVKTKCTKKGQKKLVSKATSVDINMNLTKDEQKQLDKERRHSKYYEQTMFRLENGCLIERGILKHDIKNESDEIKRYHKEWMEKRDQGVKKRFSRVKRKEEKEGEKEKKIKSRFPIQKRIILRVNKEQLLSRIIQILTLMIKSDDLYMFDPTCTGMGYKYYKGENVIVYQVDKYMNRWEKSRLNDQLDKNVVKNSSGMLFDMKDKWKIVIVTKTVWKKREMKDWFEYSIQQGYSDTLNVFTHGRNEKGKILDGSTQTTHLLKELNDKYF